MYRLDDLLHLMARLRDPEFGCPWDLQQSYATIVPHTLEEAYEVADAIEQGDFPQLREELGDLLFQVVYYSQLAREEDRFAFDEVVDGITRKLIRRHPHVFLDGDLYGKPDAAKLAEAAVKQRWEELKAEERAAKAKEPQQLSLLDDVPVALPALSRAAKLQKRAAQVGFDWPEALPVVDKVREELDEVLEAMAEGGWRPAVRRGQPGPASQGRSGGCSAPGQRQVRAAIPVHRAEPARSRPESRRVFAGGTGQPLGRG